MVIGTPRLWTTSNLIFSLKLLLLCLLWKQTHMAKGIHPNSVRDSKQVQAEFQLCPLLSTTPIRHIPYGRANKYMHSFFFVRKWQNSLGPYAAEHKRALLTAYRSWVNQLRRNVQLSILLCLLYMFFLWYRARIFTMVSLL